MKKSTLVRMVVDWSFMIGTCYMAVELISNTFHNKWEKTIEKEDKIELELNTVLNESSEDEA